IELMIALAMFAIVSLAGFTVLSSGQQSSVMNDEVVKIQQNVRLAVDLISRDVRMAGYGNPATPSTVPTTANGCTATINPTNSSTGPDSISIITVDQVIGRLTQAAPLPPATSTSAITLDSVTGLAVNDVVTVDGVFTATVNAISGTTLTLGATIQTPMTFNGDTAGKGAQVVRLACVKYSVDTTNRRLLRDGVAVVDGIEDLQLAYGVDADGDGKIDDQSGSSGIDCLDLIPNNLASAVTNSVGCSGTPPTTVSTPPTAATPTTVRLVRVSVVGRAGKSDPTFTTSSAVSVEDHNIASTTGYRRRVLTRTVSLRNLGLLGLGGGGGTGSGGTGGGGTGGGNDGDGKDGDGKDGG
ncbi:MAG: hypothetical protein D4R81_09815, partial [Nitrospiraceae bacterium]